MNEEFEMVKVLLDSKAFKQKPTSHDMGALNNRIIKHETSLPMDELALAIIAGKTFVPAIFKAINGTVKRNKECWNSQQVVALDFDEGMTLEEVLEDTFFKENAAFIYTTFSHTESKHKFRVVFVLSEVVTNYQMIESMLQELMAMYPQADKACKDATRLFFGGKELFELDYSNQLNVTDFIGTGTTLRGDIQGNDSNISPQSLPKNSGKSCEGDKYAKHIEWIQGKEITKLQAVMQIEPIELRSSEVDDFLKQQDLRKLLGIKTQGGFYDVFHDEQSPSGSIFKSKENNGHQLYKCHSESYQYVGNVLDIVKRLTSLQSVQKARAFLIELYKIKVTFSEADTALKEKLERFKGLFESPKAEMMYPNLFKVLDKHKLIADLQLVFNYAIAYIGNYKGRAIVYLSSATMAEMLHKSKSVVNRNLNMLVLFKLLKKLDGHDIPKELSNKLKKRKKQNHYSYMSSVYEVPIYSETQFNEIESMCMKWLENGCTSKTMNYEGVLRTFGEVTAKRVFPQIKPEKLSRLSEEVTAQIVQETMKQLSVKGWTTEKEVLAAVKLYFKGQKAFKEAQFKRCVSEMLDAYDLELVATNKAVKAEMNITEVDMMNVSFPKIIRHKSPSHAPVNNIDLSLTIDDVYSEQANPRILNYLNSDFDLFLPLLDVKGDVTNKGAANYVMMELIKAFKVQNKQAITSREAKLNSILDSNTIFNGSTKDSKSINEGLKECENLSLVELENDKIIILKRCFATENVA